MTYSNDSYRSQPQPTFTPAVQAGQHRQPARHAHRAQVPAPWQEQPPSRQEQSYGRAARKTGLTAAEKFWYVLGCLYFGAAYFAKIPAKKAMEDFGLAELTSDGSAQAVKLQSGSIAVYAFAMLIGLVVLVSVFLVFR